MKNASNSNTTQETLEIMKNRGKKAVVEESVNKNKFISKTPSKKEIEKESEDTSLRQETQVRIRIPCAFFSAQQVSLWMVLGIYRKPVTYTDI